jgi:hypothetical protein
MWAHISDFAIASFLYFVKKKFGEKLWITQVFLGNFHHFWRIKKVETKLWIALPTYNWKREIYN